MSSSAVRSQPIRHEADPLPLGKHVLPPGVLAIATCVAVLSRATGQQSEDIAVVVWMFTFAAIATMFADRAVWPGSVLVASAICAAVLPATLHRIGGPNPSGPIQFLAAAAATLALARALPDLSKGTRFHRGQVPRILLWTISAGFALSAALRANSAFTALALLAFGAAMLIDVLHPRSSRQRLTSVLFLDSAALAGLAALIAAMLVVAAAATGSPFGWPLAGVAAIGLVDLVHILLDERKASAQERLHLRSIAADSRLDALTGIANRRGFDERLATELARAVRYRHPLSLLMLDVDDFKRVNDEWGHPAGDRALASIAEIVRQSIRSIDIAARYGGEEFAILLPETASGGAFVVAERIRAEVEATTENPALTVSIGVATLLPDDSESAALIDRADAALYAAKRAGKNRIELAG